MSNCSRKYRKNLSNNRSRKQLYFKGGGNSDSESESDSDYQSAEEDEDLNDQGKSKSASSYDTVILPLNAREIQNQEEKVRNVITIIMSIVNNINENNCMDECIEKIFLFYKNKIKEKILDTTESDEAVVLEILNVIFAKSEVYKNKKEFVINNKLLFFAIFWYDEVMKCVKQNINEQHKEWCNNWFKEYFDWIDIDEIIKNIEVNPDYQIPTINREYNSLKFDKAYSNYDIPFYGKECIRKFEIREIVYDLSGLYNNNKIFDILTELSEYKPNANSPEPKKAENSGKEVEEMNEELNKLSYSEDLPNSEVLIGLYKKIYEDADLSFLAFNVMVKLKENEQINVMIKQIYLFNILTENDMDKLNSDEEIENIKVLLKKSMDFKENQAGGGQRGGVNLKNMFLGALLLTSTISSINASSGSSGAGQLVNHPHNQTVSEYDPVDWSTVSSQYADVVEQKSENGYVPQEWRGHSVMSLVKEPLQKEQPGLNIPADEGKQLVPYGQVYLPRAPYSGNPYVFNISVISASILTLIALSYVINSKTDEDSEMNKKIKELLKDLKCDESFCSQRKNMKGRGMT